jgi:hypothetical protein
MAPASSNGLPDWVLDFWRQKKKQELDGIDEIVVRRYAEAATSPQKDNPARGRAIRRLAHYTTLFGNETMAAYVGKWVPSYEPDMFVLACARLGS